MLFLTIRSFGVRLMPSHSRVRASFPVRSRCISVLQHPKKMVMHTTPQAKRQTLERWEGRCDLSTGGGQRLSVTEPIVPTVRAKRGREALWSTAREGEARPEISNCAARDAPIAEWCVLSPSISHAVSLS